MSYDYLFEISWEVCNKVGGLNTVVVSKSKKAINLASKLGISNYLLVGPYFPKKAYYEFQELEVPSSFKDVFEELKAEGIICHYGEWLIKGTPKVILVDFNGFIHNRDFIKGKLWEWFGIDSLGAGWDYDEPVTWAWTVGIVVEKILQKYSSSRALVHLHEWLSGAALLYLKRSSVNNRIKSVFTTHATIFGRSLASCDDNFYKSIESMDIDKKSYELCVYAKHFTEKATANNCDIFTTVSNVTSRECKFVLKREPDFVLYNGIDREKFPAIGEIEIKYHKFNRVLKEFISYYFLPYYDMSIENTLFFYTMGRPEFKNKGLDIMIDSLGKLNDILKKYKIDINVVALFFIPYNNLGMDKDLVKRKVLYEDIKDKVEVKFNEIKVKFINSLLKGKKVGPEEIFGKTFSELMYEIKDFKNVVNELPPLSTHVVSSHNEIIDSFVKCGLINRKDDKVKVILYPVYLTGADGLLNLSIYNAACGCDLGIFPSFYEPWGYTPLESAALGVPAITSNLSGFGRFVMENNTHGGIYVIDRENSNYDNSVQQLVDKMLWFVKLNDNDRGLEKIRAKKVASLATWNSFIRNYEKVYLTLMENGN